MQSKRAQVARSEISCNLKKCEGDTNQASGHRDFSPLNSIFTINLVGFFCIVIFNASNKVELLVFNFGAMKIPKCNFWFIATS